MIVMMQLMQVRRYRRALRAFNLSASNFSFFNTLHVLVPLLWGTDNIVAAEELDVLLDS